MNSLRQPLNMFQTVPVLADGSPRHYVVFDNKPHRKIRGLQTRAKAIKLPDEKIQDEVLNFAQSVWHLKDRLKQWAKLQKKKINIEALSKQSVHLQVCADLANQKKHGRMSNRSGLSPKLDEVSFDTSRSGMIELFYEGDCKEKELLVENTVPIPYSVDILINDGKESLGNAVEYICKAFDFWLPIIRELNILSNDPESKKLIELLLNNKSLTSC